MPIFKPVQEQDANESVSESYAKIKARYCGSLPDIYQVMANDPEFLASLNEHMTRVLVPRKVDAKTKEAIAFVVAAMNQCDYCINAHTRGLRRHGYDHEGIAEILGTVALWSEVTRFNIGARVSWPAEQAVCLR
jgi:AhpD family alkylhydroperoxidase